MNAHTPAETERSAYLVRVTTTIAREGMPLSDSAAFAAEVLAHTPQTLMRAPLDPDARYYFDVHAEDTGIRHLSRARLAEALHELATRELLPTWCTLPTPPASAEPGFRTLTTRPIADAYCARLETVHEREPLRTIPLLLARCAGSTPHLITAHPTSREGIAEFRAACAALWPAMPAPTRGEVKDAVRYLQRRHLAPPWWWRAPAPDNRTTRQGGAR